MTEVDRGQSDRQTRDVYIKIDKVELSSYSEHSVKTCFGFFCLFV